MAARAECYRRRSPGAFAALIGVLVVKRLVNAWYCLEPDGTLGDRGRGYALNIQAHPNRTPKLVVVNANVHALDLAPAVTAYLA